MGNYFLFNSRFKQNYSHAEVFHSSGDVWRWRLKIPIIRNFVSSQRLFTFLESGDKWGSYGNFHIKKKYFFNLKIFVKSVPKTMDNIFKKD